jgi:hypothetical protein
VTAALARAGATARIAARARNVRFMWSLLGLWLRAI